MGTSAFVTKSNYCTQVGIDEICDKNMMFLCRSQECSADLDSLAKVSKLESRIIKLKPTQQATACAEYIARLGTQAAEEEEEEAREAAALR